MANNRVYYACQAVAIQPLRDLNGTLSALGVPRLIHGLQSVGMNTSFNIEQAFELGQIQVYENIEGTPEIEVTLEKVIDGYPLIYHLATHGCSATSPSLSTTERAKLVARTKERCDLYLGIFNESFNSIADANNNIGTEVQCSGMYVNSISYTLPVDGPCTESVTLVGNQKLWAKGSPGFSKIQAARTQPASNGGWLPNVATSSEDSPKNNQNGSYVGGIQRRENVVIADSVFPASIDGVDPATNAESARNGNAYNTTTNTNKVHCQNISISVDLGREDILELGTRVPYYRPANFPVEVTSEFEVNAVSGDLVNAYQYGDPTLTGTASAGSNTKEECIIIKLNDGTVFNLGNKNRLSSVSYGGGDAGGGNATITYSYSTYNELTVTAPSDPSEGAQIDSRAARFFGNSTNSNVVTGRYQ